MKKVVFIWIFAAFGCYSGISCHSSNKYSRNWIRMDSSSKFTVSGACKIYKIDSLDNYYVIYVIKDKSRYKVISKKSSQTDLDRINPGETYDLQLTCMFGPIALGSLKPTCLDVDRGTRVCLEDSTIDLCYAENLRGLCIDSAN